MEKLGGGNGAIATTLAAYSIGRLVAFLPVGMWADKRAMKEPLCVCYVIGTVGQIMYALAGDLGTAAHLSPGHRYYILPLSRFVCGLGAASGAVTDAWIARAFAPATRPAAISANNALSLVSMLLGPAVVGVFAHMDFAIGGFPVNQCTGVGYFSAALSTVVLLAAVFFFSEPDQGVVMPLAHMSQVLIAPGSEAAYTPKRGSLGDGGASDTDTDTDTSGYDSYGDYDYDTDGYEEVQPAAAEARGLAAYLPALRRVIVVKRGWWILLVTFVVSFIISAVETMASPVMHDQFGLSTAMISIFFACFAVAGIVAIATGQFMLARGFEMRSVLLGGYFFILCGLLVMLQYVVSTTHAFAMFLLSGYVMVFGCILTSNQNAALYTLCVGSREQGFFAGLRLVVMGFARLAGPLVFAVFGPSRADKLRYLAVLAAVTLPGLLTAPFVVGKFTAREIEGPGGGGGGGVR